LGLGQRPTAPNLWQINTPKRAKNISVEIFLRQHTCTFHFGPIRLAILAKLPLSFSFFFFLTIYSHLFADFYFDFISAFGILLTPFATPPDRRGQPFPVIITMTLMPEDISLLLGPDHKRPNEPLSVVMFFSPLQAYIATPTTHTHTCASGRLCNFLI